ncbi:hypothetical protein C4K37_1597 [Pseudomonas chlororaphis subsp. piscium]|nr:hypothetical protein C4K38_1535 [Pseudomonas chlororaphis subsp. piscium]AZC35999.1 hypothetical protein C4K37_1597 [Pseudomonas chlororaphis subsp. piscium]AZC42544.1 hypothetical protein C4K36_1604 [Pseudomonas chlororaphis subsp. piscium]
MQFFRGWRRIPPIQPQDSDCSRPVSRQHSRPAEKRAVARAIKGVAP